MASAPERADCLDDSSNFATAHISCARCRIGFTYLLTAAENILELLYPLAGGLAIDGLLVGLPYASVGSIFAGVAYLLQAIDALDHAPDAVQQISRLIDIRRRMQTGRVG